LQDGVVGRVALPLGLEQGQERLDRVGDLDGVGGRPGRRM
jgi:hypothetical protein